MIKTSRCPRGRPAHEKDTIDRTAPARTAAVERYQRAELIAAMQSGGLKAFLEARDGGFQPEPFGPRSAPKS